jgi:hypothetical protein
VGVIVKNRYWLGRHCEAGQNAHGGAGQDDGGRRGKEYRSTVLTDGWSNVGCHELAPQPDKIAQFLEHANTSDEVTFPYF